MATPIVISDDTLIIPGQGFITERRTLVTEKILTDQEIQDEIDEKNQTIINIGLLKDKLVQKKAQVQSQSEPVVPITP